MGRCFSCEINIIRLQGKGGVSYNPLNPIEMKRGRIRYDISKIENAIHI